MTKNTVKRLVITIAHNNGNCDKTRRTNSIDFDQLDLIRVQFRPRPESRPIPTNWTRVEANFEQFRPQFEPLQANSNESRLISTNWTRFEPVGSPPCSNHQQLDLLTSNKILQNNLLSEQLHTNICERVYNELTTTFSFTFFIAIIFFFNKKNAQHGVVYKKYSQPIKPKK